MDVKDSDLIYDMRRRIDELELRTLQDFKQWVKSLSNKECKAIAVFFLQEWLSRD